MGDEKSKVEKNALEMPHRAQPQFPLRLQHRLDLMCYQKKNELTQSWREDNIISILNIAFLLIAFSASQIYLYEMDSAFNDDAGFKGIVHQKKFSLLYFNNYFLNLF